MSQSLLGSRRFAPLFWCQFFSAFNDNFLKNALALLILFKIGGQSGESLVTSAGGIFIAPFFLMSALGGQLADRFDKALVVRRLKLGEIGAAAIAVAAHTEGAHAADRAPPPPAAISPWVHQHRARALR